MSDTSYPEIIDKVDAETKHGVTPHELTRLAACIRTTTAARGVDLWAVNEIGIPAAEWARMTDRDRSTVARNVRRANETAER